MIEEWHIALYAVAGGVYCAIRFKKSKFSWPVYKFILAVTLWPVWLLLSALYYEVKK